jgi:uncharacterized protein (TIGR00299 family) protein
VANFLFSGKIIPDDFERFLFMKIAYFDCFAGAGGDMIVSAMLDAGLDEKFLKKQLATLGLKKLNILTTRVTRAGIQAIHFKPAAPQHQPTRNLKQIIQIINRSKIDQPAKKTAIQIFKKLADAEAAVHGKDKMHIHFHEVGAVDSIVDIVSAAIGFHFFRQNGIEKFYCSTISIGSGMVKTAHGLLPVPAPATALLIKNIPVTKGPADVELLTPTAAAVLTTIVDCFGPLPTMKFEKIGYGAGSLNLSACPNVLRLIIGRTEELEKANADSVCLLETNIDDTSGEVVGYVTEKLLEAGAFDVYTTAIYMKHNRPAVKLSVICKPDDEGLMSQLIMQQGLTFGIRRQLIQRYILSRNYVTVKTSYGKIKIKVGKAGDKTLSVKPEFSDCKTAAQKNNVPLKTVIDSAIAAYYKGDNIYTKGQPRRKNQTA